MFLPLPALKTNLVFRNLSNKKVQESYALFSTCKKSRAAFFLLTSRRFYRHTTTYSLKNYIPVHVIYFMILKCTHCDYLTIYKGHMQRHNETKHAHEKQEEAPSPHTDSRFHCSMCTYSTDRQYNLTRHMVSKHEKRSETLQKSPESLQKSPESLQNSLLSLQKSPESLQNSLCIRDEMWCHSCQFCKQNFTRKDNLLVHMKRCRGAPVLECKWCGRMFKTAKLRWNHETNCSCTSSTEQEPDSDPLQVPQSKHTRPQQSQSGFCAQTNHINHANTVNIQNNVTNNTINLVAFPTEGVFDGRIFCIPRKDESVFYKKLKEAVRNNNTPLAIEKAILALLDVSENRILRKADLKNPYTYVHTGEGQWEPHLDKRIYPKVIHQATCDLVDSFETASYRCKESGFIRELGEFSGNVQQFVDDEPIQMTNEERIAKRHMKDIERNIKIKAHHEYKQRGLH